MLDGLEAASEMHGLSWAVLWHTPHALAHLNAHKQGKFLEVVCGVDARSSYFKYA